MTNICAEIMTGSSYILWLCAMIDYNNGETARYNNSVALYNARWSAYRNYYNSTHLPRETKMKFF